MSRSVLIVALALLIVGSAGAKEGVEAFLLALAVVVALAVLGVKGLVDRGGRRTLPTSRPA